ncbi:2-amino-4-hydroxy-6-hydroxymethyldihydropteridine diphosphokinase [Stieleria sp. TO1_6]|uniref:2-amino-4-hydroxy-6- hydroxymethyldihydropteridine diphosphokinase n=1 Tax=Stieleria tagensis TaxID=2956795 RepID=UPI00209B1B75|nr:2-amino-4-hydroxy-6-hydroxymethyldihydropteridine diphosphokinase [Stieleria tagensis]MCO8123176.1 2-amino-4-hydroxy-6-hydroxymethyldihydropteridine diphosphokinase [Stieleria tagensis]
MNEPESPLSHPLPGRRAIEPSRISQCVISFGSNLGHRRELISLAAQQIAASDVVLRGSGSQAGGLQTSRLFETPPIGGPGGQEPFLNAVGVFQTVAPARAVLSLLQGLEDRLGRERRRRWDARSIDLDVVLHGQLVGGTTGLVVPHPRYTARQFVLQPACDVAAHFRDPRFGWTLQELADHLSADVPSLALVSGRAEVRQELCRRLRTERGIAIREFSPDSLPPTAPWVSSEMPHLPSAGQASVSSLPGLPRLLVRIHQANGVTRWPAPHLMWPGGWRWPEYRLEIDAMDWAVSELASALDSMRCEGRPVTADGGWW